MSNIDYKKKIELSLAQYKQLVDFSKDIGIEMFASCWDTNSLKQIKKIGFEVKNYDDGKTYLNKGKYILKIENKTIDFSVK